MFTMTKDKMENAKEELINEGGPAGQSPRDAARRFKDEARNTANDLKDGAHDVRDSLESVARRTGRHIRGLADTAGEGAETLRDNVTKSVREKPGQSALVIFAVGLLAGLLVSRR